MKGKTIIITGANSGIGKEAAVELLEQGAKVILACRDLTKADEVISSLKTKEMQNNAIPMKLDIGNYDSIFSFVKEFKNKIGTADILINNAGVYLDKFEKKGSAENTMKTNHLGPVVLTLMLLDSLKNEGKIINVASVLYKAVSQKEIDSILKDTDFEELRKNYKFGSEAYNYSKLGNVYFTVQLADYLQNKKLDIKTASLHPGYVHTQFHSKTKSILLTIVIFLFRPIKWFLMKSAKMGAQTTLHLAYMDFIRLNSGAYFADCQEEKLTKIGSNRENVREFMNYTKNLIEKELESEGKEIPRELQEYFNYMKQF